MVLSRYNGQHPAGLRRDPTHYADAHPGAANTFPRGLQITPDPEAVLYATGPRRRSRLGTMPRNRWRRRSYDLHGLRTSPRYSPPLQPRVNYDTYNPNQDVYATYARKENERLFNRSQFPAYGNEQSLPPQQLSEVSTPVVEPRESVYPTAVATQGAVYPPAVLPQTTAYPHIPVPQTDTYPPGPEPQVATYSPTMASQAQLATYSPATMTQTQLATYAPATMPQAQLATYAPATMPQAQLATYSPATMPQAQLATYAPATIGQASTLAPAQGSFLPPATIGQGSALPMGVPMLPRIAIAGGPTETDGVPPLNPAAAAVLPVHTGNFFVMTEPPQQEGVIRPNVKENLYENEFIGHHRFVYSICKLPALVLMIVALGTLFGKGKLARMTSERNEGIVAMVTGLTVLAIQIFGLHNHNHSHTAAFLQTSLRLVHLLAKFMLSGVTVALSIIAIIDVRDQEDSATDWRTKNHTIYTHDERLTNSAVTLGMSLMILFLSVIAIIYGVLALLKLLNERNERKRKSE